MKSLTTALRVLACFGDDDVELGVTDICQRTGLGKSQVSKMLAAFRESGLLQQRPTSRKYAVGIRAFMLGSRFVNQHPASRVALPAMRKLVDEIGHSVTLSVLQGDDLVHLLSVEGQMYVESRWRVGRAISLHTSSSGRVLLSALAEEAIDGLVARRGLPQLTPSTITDPKKFKAALRQVRAKGYAWTQSEGVPGLGAAAVPVMGGDGRVVAALAAIFPEHLVPSDLAAPLVQRLHGAAREISGALGWYAYPYGVHPRDMLPWPSGPAKENGRRRPATAG